MSWQYRACHWGVGIVWEDAWHCPEVGVRRRAALGFEAVHIGHAVNKNSWAILFIS